MPIIEFATEYTYQDDPAEGIVLSIEIAASKSVRLRAHVDTGAAYCLFRGEYAEMLGLTLTAGTQMNFSPAGGGTIIGYGHEVTIKALDFEVESIVYFTENPNFGRNVLGRQGWLHHFKLGLIFYESKLYLARQGH